MIAGVSGWAGSTVARRVGDVLYRVDALDVGLVIGAITLLLGGAGLLLHASRLDVALPALLAALLGVFGVLAIFSIGLLFLLAAALPLHRAARRASAGPPGSGRGVAAGVLIAVGLGLLLLTWPHGPFVECHQGGSSTTGSWRDSRGGGGATVTPDGAVDGWVRFGSERYEYRCRKGELTHLERLE